MTVQAYPLSSFRSPSLSSAALPYTRTEGGALMNILLISTQPARLRGMIADLDAGGFHTELADEGRGKRRARAGRHQAIVLDADSADDRKLDWLAQWRRAGVAARVLVLLVDSVPAHERVQCLERGADDYLLKPFDGDELRARLLALVQRTRKSESLAYTVHDLEIEPALHTVIRNGRRIKLTRREFDLLNFLIEHRGQIVKRNAILEHLYGHLEEERRSNVVDVYVSYLRRKIDADSDRPLIRTHWGQGYEFAKEEA